MSTKHPRADAKLKRLPESVQARIAERLGQPGVTQKDVLAWLRTEHSVSSSAAALSDWLSWYALRQQLARNESAVEALITDLAHKDPSVSPEKLQELGQQFFSALAVQTQDPKTWFLTQQIALKGRQLDLDREKFQRETCELFLKWAADKRALEIASGPSATNAAKIEQLGQLMFGEDWKS